MHNFTTEDLIQLIYNETSAKKTAAIKTALEADCALREKYDEIKSAHHILGRLSFSPLEKTIDNIVEYAEKSTLHLTDQV